MTTRTLRETRRHLELISSSNYYAEFEQPPSDDEGVKDMKTTTALVLLALGALALSGCTLIGKGVAGSGVRKTEKRNLKSFKAIDTTGAYEMDVTCQKP